MGPAGLERALFLPMIIGFVLAAAVFVMVASIPRGHR
jgi:hypothetical protein